MAGLSGSHWAARYARLLGCPTGENVDLHADPPVTGLAAFGDGCVVESEVDVSGVWLDGGALHVGAVERRRRARVGPGRR